MATMLGTSASSWSWRGIVGAKVLLIINEWIVTLGNWREIFSLNTLQSGGVFFGRP